MEVSPICLLNKADQFYSGIELLRIGLNLPSFDNHPHLTKAVKQIIIEYLKEKPYETLIDFLAEVSIYNQQGEEE